MKKNGVKRMAVWTAAAMMAVGMMGCGNSPAESSAADEAKAGANDNPAGGESGDLSGSVTMAGSTSMEKLANAVAEAFIPNPFFLIPRISGQRITSQGGLADAYKV